ncbi:MAG: tRNA-specific adenosine deaminase [Syntrophus sp. PtaU1.Bin005]|jgi:tRNA(adenine34) deaminase|uniref:tRNA adenosine(34) deaminase TadA n=1 Tax=Syntrophus TaxID=43773 RepID=UPI0009C4632A|nr:MAG: tRNA-specific adenosine deaminase [Syntrophus sp. PtaB.Bin138]OPY79514.1 MAG: tRNA-specific adenosine deaminase [Syntrophus sp. PtaU1.Bin005]
MKKGVAEPERGGEIPSRSPDSGTKEDERWMEIALEEARLAAAEGEVPVGAVLLWQNSVIARSHNQPIARHDPTAHAEILAIREASEIMKNYRLTGMTLYVTLEPCIMCAGAILQARLARLVYGAGDPKGGAVSSVYRVLQDSRLNHAVEVTGNVLSAPCAEILSGFFQEKRITSGTPNG